MRITLGLAAAGGLLVAPLTGGAATAYRQFRVTNDTARIVECVLLVDGHTRTYLKVHPGKAYFDTFSEGRQLQLACMRGKEGVYGPLKLGVDYRFVAAPSDRVDLAAN